MHKGKYVVIGIYFLITVLQSLLMPFVAPFLASHFTQVPTAIIPADADKFAKEYVLTLKSGNFEVASSMTSEKLVLSTDQVSDISKILANTDLDTGRVIYTEIQKGSRGSQYLLSYEFENANPEKKYIDIRMNIANTDKGLRANGVNISSNNVRAVEASANFDFQKQGLSLALFVVVSLLAIFTAIYYIRNFPKPRWWILLVILLVIVEINISTGGASVNFGPSFNSTVLFAVSIPLGVIWFWIFRKKIFAKEQTVVQNI